MKRRHETNPLSSSERPGGYRKLSGAPRRTPAAHEDFFNAFSQEHFADLNYLFGSNTEEFTRQAMHALNTICEARPTLDFIEIRERIAFRCLTLAQFYNLAHGQRDWTPFTRIKPNNQDCRSYTILMTEEGREIALELFWKAMVATGWTIIVPHEVTSPTSDLQSGTYALSF